MVMIAVYIMIGVLLELIGLALLFRSDDLKRGYEELKEVDNVVIPWAIISICLILSIIICWPLMLICAITILFVGRSR